MSSTLLSSMKAYKSTDPERGDTIIFNNCRYEVLAPNGEPVWRWSGAYHSTRRIHTKEIGAVNA